MFEGSMGLLALVGIEAAGAILTALAVVVALRWSGREQAAPPDQADVERLSFELNELRRAVDRLAEAQAVAAGGGSADGSEGEPVTERITGVAPAQVSSRQPRGPGGFTISI